MTEEESNNTIWNTIWLKYNSLRTRYKPQKVVVFDSNTERTLREFTQEEFRSLLYKAQRKRIYKRDHGFLVGMSKKYHYNVSVDEPLILSDRQFAYLNRLASR